MSALPGTDVALSKDRPLHDFILLLPDLVVTDGVIDFKTTPKETLRALAEHAETVMRTSNAGINSISQLLAHAAAGVEDGAISANSIEGVGWLLAELSELAALCDYMAACCRKELVEPLRIRSKPFKSR